MNKRALSPVIATVLLIALVLILALIIFLWARAFIPEQLEKGGSPVQDACNDVAFTADYASPSVTIRNDGNVPLYGVEMAIKSGFSQQIISGDFIAPSSIRAGETRTFDLGENAPSSGQLVIIPLILGRATNGELKAFVCGDEFAETIEVQ